MKKYIKFIKENLENVDPYGEEWWDDLDLKVNDKIMCRNVNDLMISRRMSYAELLEDDIFTVDKVYLDKDFLARNSRNNNLYFFTKEEGNYFEKIEESHVINEKLGISDVVYRTAEKIYEDYNLEWYQRAKRDNIKKAIIIDTKELESPFNEMRLVLYFDNKERPKNVRGGIDRIKAESFNVYIYYTSKNVFRTLAHELDHVYQVFLRKKHFSTDKDKTPSPYRKSEESPQMMSVYALLLQKDIKSKKDFIEKLNKLPTYKKYKKILVDEKETPEHKRIANKMLRKMDKLYGLFQNDIKE